MFAESTFVQGTDAPPGFPSSGHIPITGYNPLASHLGMLQANSVVSAPNVKNIVTTVLNVVEDYLPWRTQFESFLVSNGLLGMIFRSIPIPPMFIYDSLAARNSPVPQHDLIQHTLFFGARH